MAKYSQEQLLKMANELLAKDKEGREILEAEREIDVHIINSYFAYQEREDLTHISEFGEGVLRYCKENGNFYVEGLDSNPPRCGIGSFLLNQLEEIASKEKIQKITARVCIENKNTRRFLSLKGFQEKETDHSVFPPEIYVEKRVL